MRSTADGENGVTGGNVLELAAEVLKLKKELVITLRRNTEGAFA